MCRENVEMLITSPLVINILLTSVLLVFLILSFLCYKKQLYFVFSTYPHS